MTLFNRNGLVTDQLLTAMVYSQINFNSNGVVANQSLTAMIMEIGI